MNKFTELEVYQELRDGGDWRPFGTCAQPEVDPNLFAAPDDGETKKEKIHRESMAQVVCGSCIVTDFCSENAMRQKDIHTIRPGLDERKRAASRK